MSLCNYQGSAAPSLAAQLRLWSLWLIVRFLGWGVWCWLRLRVAAAESKFDGWICLRLRVNDTKFGFGWGRLILSLEKIVQTFPPIILIWKKGNFISSNWMCTSIYRIMSYPLGSLQSTIIRTTHPKFLNILTKIFEIVIF